MITKLVLFFILLTEILSKSICQKFLGLHPEYQSSCKMTHMLDQSIAYSVQEGEQPYILIFYVQGGSTRPEELKKFELKQVRDGIVDDSPFVLFEEGDFSMLNDLVYAGEICTVDLVMLNVLKMVQEIKTLGFHNSNLSYSNILIDHENGSVRMLDTSQISKGQGLEDEYNQISDLMTYIKKVYDTYQDRIVREDCKKATVRFDSFLEHLNNVGYDDFSLEKLISVFEEMLNEDVDVELELKALHRFKKTTELNLKTPKYKYLSDGHLDDHRLAMLIILLSMLFVVLLIITIYLLAEKEPNITEDDLEMRGVIGRPQIQI